MNIRHEHRIYPIFLPHAGCPFQCVYCNQRAVTHSDPTSSLISSFEEQLSRVIEEVRRCTVPGEIAFYGGTFTALPFSLLRDILNEASSWVEKGLFTGIRFSTRPDGITSGICSFLEHYPVQTVELGVQSFSDKVLIKSCRGYGSEAVYRAVSLIGEKEWSLGLQLMMGLPGDTRRHFLDSVSKAVALKPSFIRLYPTLVLHGTLLAQWYRDGLYRPPELEETLDWCAEAYDACLKADVPVARLGLHADPELEKPGTVLAGPHHPALGYLVRVRWWRNRVDEVLAEHHPVCGRVTIRVPERSISEVLGPGRSNVNYWQNKWHLEKMKIQRESQWTSSKRFECNIGL